MFDISQVNRKVAINRWNNRDNKIISHLATIKKDDSYILHKARLMGYLAGDGCIAIRLETGRNVLHHEIAFYPDDIMMVHLFKESFILLYTKEPNVTQLKNHYRVYIACRPAVLDLLQENSFGTLSWKVPIQFLSTKESRIEWTRAFFDCEGHVAKRVIQIQSVNQQGLEQVRQFLASQGIESNICHYRRTNPNWRDNFILTICRIDSIIRYATLIGFNNVKKREKLRALVASVA